MGLPHLSGPRRIATACRSPSKPLEWSTRNEGAWMARATRFQRHRLHGQEVQARTQMHSTSVRAPAKCPEPVPRPGSRSSDRLKKHGACSKPRAFEGHIPVIWGTDPGHSPGWCRACCETHRSRRYHPEFGHPDAGRARLQPPSH